jgi:hypothetical protein
MAIEFIPRKTQEIPTEKIFFFVSLGILIFITGLSVFLVVSNQEKEKIKTDLGNQITQLQSKEINELEGQVLFRKMQLEKAKEMLLIHMFPSRIFDFLETNLVKGVKISKLDISFDDKTAIATIEGKTSEFRNISLQEMNFKKQENLDNFSISEIEQEPITGKIIFSLEAKFKEEFLKY